MVRDELLTVIRDSAHGFDRLKDLFLEDMVVASLGLSANFEALLKLRLLDLTLVCDLVENVTAQLSKDERRFMLS